MIDLLPAHLVRAALGLMLGAVLGMVARRGRFCTLGAIEDAVLLAGLGASRATAAPATGPKTHRVAMQVSSREGDVFDLALNNAVNLARDSSAQAEDLEVEIVALAQACPCCGPTHHP